MQAVVLRCVFSVFVVDMILAILTYASSGVALCFSVFLLDMILALLTYASNGVALYFSVFCLLDMILALLICYPKLPNMEVLSSVITSFLL